MRMNTTMQNTESYADKRNGIQTLNADALCFSYKSAAVLDGISFSLQGPGLTAVLGPNGSGKTTLLRCLINMLHPQSGTVRINRKLVSEISPRRMAAYTAYVAQKQEARHISVFDAVLLGRIPHLGMRAEQYDLSLVQKTLQDLHLEDFALRSLMQLSGGELQKVSLARALVQETPFMLLDEPTASLDMKNQLQILSILRSQAAGKGIHALISIHDLNTAFRFADRFIFLKNGMIAADVDRTDLKPEMVHDVYEVPVTMRWHKDVPEVTPMI